MRILTAALSFAFVTAAFAADAPPPAKAPTIALVRGTIESFDGKVLKIKTSAGAEVAGVQPPQPRVSAVESRTLEQLKPTDFVGITAVDGPNGHLVAEEIHIIPVAGLGEGQYPWDHHPDNSGGATRAGSMTNGTVQAPSATRAGSMTNGTVTSDDKHQLKVTFRGAEMVNGKCVGHAPPTGGCTGTATVDVTGKTYIQAIVPATVADIKAGLAVAATSATTADGAVVFVSVVVEKNGVKPEF
jgi:hypothetical protein